MEIINEKNFEEKIKDGVVLVDFFATWCGPCRMQAAILEQCQKQLEELNVSVVKVDVDECENLAHQFSIMSIPTMVLFANGEQKEKHVGLLMEEDLIDFIKKYL